MTEPEVIGQCEGCSEPTDAEIEAIARRNEIAGARGSIVPNPQLCRESAATIRALQRRASPSDDLKAENERLWEYYKANRSRVNARRDWEREEAEERVERAGDAIRAALAKKDSPVGPNVGPGR